MLLPISARAISDFPTRTWIADTTVASDAFVDARATSPIVEIIGNPKNRVVIAVEITVLPLV